MGMFPAATSEPFDYRADPAHSGERYVTTTYQYYCDTCGSVRLSQPPTQRRRRQLGGLALGLTLGAVAVAWAGRSGWSTAAAAATAMAAALCAGAAWRGPRAARALADAGVTCLACGAQYASLTALRQDNPRGFSVYDGGRRPPDWGRRPALTATVPKYTP